MCGHRRRIGRADRKLRVKNFDNGASMISLKGDESRLTRLTKPDIEHNSDILW